MRHQKQTARKNRGMEISRNRCREYRKRRCRRCYVSTPLEVFRKRTIKVRKRIRKSIISLLKC